MANGERPTYEKGQLYNLPVMELKSDPNQPRKSFDPQAMEEMVASVGRHGVIQPVLFRRDDSGAIYIVAGERRLAAAKSVGIQTIPAIFVNGNHAEIALIENLLRQDLTAVEEAEALDRIVKEQGYKQEDLAKVIGKSTSTISEILSLNRLPIEIRDDCRANRRISRRTLVEIAKSKQQRAMLTLYKKYKVQNLSRDEIKQRARRIKKTVCEQTVILLNAAKEKLTTLPLENCTLEEKDQIIPTLKALKETIDECINSLTEPTPAD